LFKQIHGETLKKAFSCVRCGYLDPAMLILTDDTIPLLHLTKIMTRVAGTLLLCVWVHGTEADAKAAARVLN